MLGRVAHFWLQLRASGLQQDAVIEVMLALLGAMIAILALISAVIAVAVGVIGFLGFQAIRDEAKKRAEEVATKVAEATATKIASESLNQIWAQIQASGLSEGQSEIDPAARVPSSSQSHEVPARKRRKATTDSSLKEGGKS